MDVIQEKAIEEKLSAIIRRIERIEDKESISEDDEMRLLKYGEQLHGADMILTIMGYVREYHSGEASDELHGYYTLKKI